MYDIFKRDHLLIFAGGLVTGLVGLKIAKNKKTRSAVVKTVAKGMMAKDCVMEEYTNIREEAEDICAEAREIAGAKSEEAEVCTESAE